MRHEPGDALDGEAPTRDLLLVGRLFAEEKFGISLSMTKFLCEKLFARFSYCVISRRHRACCYGRRSSTGGDFHEGSLCGSGSGIATLPTTGADKAVQLKGY